MASTVVDVELRGGALLVASNFTLQEPRFCLVIDTNDS
jgi:hypothetical protein